jgi:hypothetical protein
MAWNYRVLAYKNNLGEMFFNIFEVQYNEKNMPISYHPEPVELESESIYDLNTLIFDIEKAFQKRVLKMWDFPNEYDEDTEK